MVVNLTIPAAHYEINMKALNAGKNVYCEKPLALNLEDAEATVKLAKEKGLIACQRSGHIPWRWRPDLPQDD